MKYLLIAVITLVFFSLNAPAHAATTLIADVNLVPSPNCLSSNPCTAPIPSTTIIPNITTTPSGTSTISGQPTSSSSSSNPSGSPSPTSTTPCSSTESSISSQSTSSIHSMSPHVKHRPPMKRGGLQQFFELLLQLLQFLFQKLGIQLPSINPCGSSAPSGSPSPVPSSAPTTIEPSTSSPSSETTPSSADTPSSGAAPTGSGSSGTTTTTTCTGNSTGGSVSLTGYTLVNCEDFNETGLSAGTLPSGWNAYSGNTTVVGTGRTPSQCDVANGLVTLTQNSSGATCGMASSFGQKYGLWEVRMRAYTTGNGSGSAPHPVLILWPDSNLWPSGGEYDYAEANIGSKMQAFFHCATSAGGNCATGTSNVDFSQWHNYAIKWTSTSVTGYIDGQQWITTTDADARAPGSMHQTIQLDNLSGQTPVDPGVMQVDWVHVYKQQ